MKVACLSLFILPLKMSRWNMRCYHSFRLNTKNKFQDKQKALSFTKRKPNQNKVQERKTKFFKKFSSKAKVKLSFQKCSQQD